MDSDIKPCPFCLQSVFVVDDRFVAHDAEDGSPCATIACGIATAIIHGNIIDATFDGLLAIRKKALDGRPSWVGCACYECRRRAARALRK